MRFDTACPLSGLILSAVFGSVLRADDARLVPPGVVFVPSAAVVSYVEQSVVRDDLKLTPEQQARIADLRVDLQKADVEIRAGHKPVSVDQVIANSIEAIVRLEDILSPGQIRRHEQIVMQHLLVRYGLVQLVQAIDVAALLEPGETQQSELQTILRTTGNGERGGRGAPRQLLNRRDQRAPANRPLVPNQPDGPPPEGRGRPSARGQSRPNARSRQARVLDLFTNPDLAQFEQGPQRGLFENANNQISRLLTDAQKKRLLEILGPALVSHPSGPGPAVLRQGMKQFAFSRVATRDAWRRSYEIGRTPIARHPVLPALLSQPAVRAELKLTAEMAARLPPVSGDLSDFSQFGEEVARRLEPEQWRRLQELALQTVDRDFGAAALFEFQEVAEAVPLTEKRRAALVDHLRSELRSTRAAVRAAVERDPQMRREFDTEAAERLNEILTREQRDTLSELLGKPFEGPLSAVMDGIGSERRTSIRARVAPALGHLASVPTGYLNAARVWGKLQHLADDPPASANLLLERFPAPSFTLPSFELPSIRLPPTEFEGERLRNSLLSQQERRYVEIVLQGSIKREGPASVFRYRPVIEALALSPDQDRHLLDLLWEDTRRYLSIPRAELVESLPTLDKETSATIDSILSDEQRETLARLLGKPVDDLNEPSNEQTDRALDPPGQPASPTAPVRRLVYRVRHQSAEELAEAVRSRFPIAENLHAKVAPAGNMLLISAPLPVFDEVRAAVSELDRPIRRVIVEVMLFETPLASLNVAGAEEERLEDGEFSGPAGQVAARLEELSRRKKISGLRQFRLEISEIQTGRLLAGTDTRGISAANGPMENGFWQPESRIHRVGTSVVATPHVTRADRISLDLQLQDLQLYTPADADELGIGPDGLFIARAVRTSLLAATARLPIGEAVAVHGIQTDPNGDSQETRVVVAVQLVENKSP
jgi:hypothetical protein